MGGANTFNETAPQRCTRPVFVGGRLVPVVVAVDTTPVTNVQWSQQRRPGWINVKI